MSTDRIPSSFDDPITNERVFLDRFLNNGKNFPEIKSLGESEFQNPCSEEKVGKYRGPNNRKSVTAHLELINKCIELGKPIPSFLIAGPRNLLFRDPSKIKAAIVTTGGLAPGLNCVINSIVNRHYKTYGIKKSNDNPWGVKGIYESYRGACDLSSYMRHLTPSNTERWLEKGGSMLGMRRYYPDGDEPLPKKQEELAQKIASELEDHNINILYVIGGDGSLSTAHQIALKAKNISVVGIPKTMDNDVMWVSESFGFKTTVENTTHIINTLNSEAESTRRVGLIEVFGAESGFVAAHSALASGHVDLVLIPEEFQCLTKEECESALMTYINYLKEKIENTRVQDGEPHAIVVLAEGAAKILKQKKVSLGGMKVDDNPEKGFLVQLKNYLKREKFLIDRDGIPVDVFFNRPRHYIRATPANSHDQVYCDQLGAMAVDSALAGYTDFMISQWHNSFVLVPLELVADKHKRISPKGTFWKQVTNNTGQPIIESQNPDLCDSDM